MNRTAAIVAVSLALSLVVASAHAFNPQPEPPPGSLPVSFGWDQAIRVHVVNVIDQLRPLFPRDETGAVDESCAVEMSIVDTDGLAIVVVDTIVGPGQIRSTQLTGRRLGLEPGERRTVRAVVRFTGETEDRIRCQATTRASLELLGARGAIPPDDGVPPEPVHLVLEIPTTWVSGIDPQPF